MVQVYCVQWNLSIKDTSGPIFFVCLFVCKTEVFLFER